jgi:hypothetical protein
MDLSLRMSRVQSCTVVGSPADAELQTAAGHRDTSQQWSSRIHGCKGSGPPHLQKDQTRCTPVLPLPDTGNTIQPFIWTSGEDSGGGQLSSLGDRKHPCKKIHSNIYILMLYFCRILFCKGVCVNLLKKMRRMRHFARKVCLRRLDL